MKRKVLCGSLSAVLVMSSIPCLAWADTEQTQGGGELAAQSEDAIAWNRFDEGDAQWAYDSQANVLMISGTDFPTGWANIVQKGLGKTALTIKKFETNLVVCEGVTDTSGYTQILGAAKLASLKSIELPSTITKFPYTGKKLEKFSFPNGCNITSLSDQAFNENEGLTSIDFSDWNLTAIPLDCFRGTKNISKLILPQNGKLGRIESGAFMGMQNIESIDIPEGVTFIGFDAFQTASFSEIYLPSTLEEIGEGINSKGEPDGKITLAENGINYGGKCNIHVRGCNELQPTVKQGLEATVEHSTDATVWFEQRFDANYGGADPIATQEVAMGTGLDAAEAEASNAPVLMREGYDFTGWYADPDCTVPYDFTAPMEHGAIAYAGWEEQHQFVRVDVNYGNGSENGTITADENGMIAKPDTDPVRAGYKFTGWFSDEACTTAFNFAKPVVDGACLYAGWKQIVSVDVNYGNGSENGTITADENGMIAKPDTDPVRAGYKFTGWFSDEACTTEFDFAKPVVDGACLYAGWKQIVSVDVNYGNGSENGTITADENGMIAEPDTDPVRAGYKFTGWFSDEACTTEFDFAKPVVDGACLYAGWTPVKAIVSNVDGTKTDLQVKSDGTIAEPMAPTRDGYVFKGWYSDPYCTRAFDFEHPLYDDVTLYSKWEAKASEPTPTGGTTDTGNTGSGGNAKQPAAQPNGSQNSNGIQQTNSASNAGAQTLAQTGDAATGAVPAVAFVSAMAAAVVGFARKRIARR